MSKAHRGRGILDKPNKGRGQCPVCKRTGVKLLYAHSMGEKEINVCKTCSKAITHGKKKEALQEVAE